jgi:hypothetical protein
LAQQLREPSGLAAAEQQHLDRGAAGEPGKRARFGVRHFHPGEAGLVVQCRGQAFSEQPV